MHLNPRTKRLNTAKAVPTTTTQKNRKYWKRNVGVLGATADKQPLLGDFMDAKAHTLSERAALREAARCLKCADAPCEKVRRELHGGRETRRVSKKIKKTD